MTTTNPMACARRIGKCRMCSGIVAWVGIFQRRCDCGAVVKGKAIVATKVDKVCDAKCYNAKSAGCACSCDGENHGGAHQARRVLS